MVSAGISLLTFVARASFQVMTPEGHDPGAGAAILEDMDWLTVIGALVAGLAAVGALWVTWRQRRIETGLRYLERYWKIDEDLIASPKVSKRHIQDRYRYLRLCEDQFDAASRTWIDPGQWRVWHSWLATAATQEQLKEDLRAVKQAGHGGFDALQRCLWESGGHAWRRCPGRKQKLELMKDWIRQR